ncbi:hypothetical protein D3C80_2228610 [compost metagenome]
MEGDAGIEAHQMVFEHFPVPFTDPHSIAVILVLIFLNMRSEQLGCRFLIQQPMVEQALPQ